MVIPANLRTELGLQDGRRLIAHLVDRAVVLEPVDSAVRRAQALAVRFVPQAALPDVCISTVNITEVIAKLCERGMPSAEAQAAVKALGGDCRLRMD
ncbi:hypothetical protein ABAC402_17995 [Asticcacaulis sp. AC402]|nr:hypothetical protein ABAC402_17995 [Asticcacaulis sp. AC402]